jgi:hypothetical protein
MLDFTYPNIRNLFSDYLDPKRTESASFLIWYLEKYYRLDPSDAENCVCDQKGDKGIDGIYINENEGFVDVFQSKISQKKISSIGDATLREFSGTLSQFQNADSLKILLASAGDAEVARLIKRIDLVNKINDFEIRGIFLSNVDIDKNGQDFLKTSNNIIFIGKSTLIDSYISDQRSSPISNKAKFDISGFSFSEYIVDDSTRAINAPVKAIELVKLNGIADKSLFLFNVREHLGRTQVNKDIVSSIKDKTKHKLFPLFHNGITITCSYLTSDNDYITIDKYSVVNGCQSLSELYNNKSDITGDLRILTKFVSIDDMESPLLKSITEKSNNQNGTKARDFKSNSYVQVRLQNDFKKHFNDIFYYEIKRGESTPETAEIISNEIAGLYLMAFDLKEPWGTHRKYQVFEDKHSEIFGRPEVNAHRIVMLHLIVKAVLLSCHASNVGYSLFSFTRALEVVNCQLIFAFRLFLCICHDSVMVRNLPMVSSLPPRH